MIKRVVLSGFSVLSVAFIAFLPFLKHVLAVKDRLFPWGRGLTHAYWAPNFWSLYNTLDVVLNFVVNRQMKTEYTQGFVKVCNHAILPNISPGFTFLLILIGLVFLARFVMRSEKDEFCESLCISGMIFYLFGWHVHEKAIMTISLPMM